MNTPFYNYKKKEFKYSTIHFSIYSNKK